MPTRVTLWGWDETETRTVSTEMGQPTTYVKRHVRRGMLLKRL